MVHCRQFAKSLGPHREISCLKNSHVSMTKKILSDEKSCKIVSFVLFSLKSAEMSEFR